MNAAGVTFTLLVKNEERRLPRALASIPAGARILTVDCGCTDRSVEIAQRAGAQVVAIPFDGFVKTRRAALAHVTTPWTFMLDADERLDETLRAAVAGIDDKTRLNGFTVSRRTWLSGRPINGCGWGDERMLRMFRTNLATLRGHPASGGSAELHERWSVPGDAPLLPGRLEHESYPTIADYFRRYQRYTSIEAAGLPKSPFRLLAALIGAVPRAVWLLAGRAGWKDGWRGVFVSIFSALYPVVANAKALFR